MGNLEGLRAGLKLLVGKSVATSFSILCIFVFLVHVAFQIEFNCTCSGADKLHCWTYMVLPGVLISSITLWADKRFRSLYAFTCNSNRYRCLINSKGCCHFCCKFVMHVLKAILSGFIWVASLLLDGDWYVCCKSHPANQTYPCKTKDELSLEERTALALQKNISMMTLKPPCMKKIQPSLKSPDLHPKQHRCKKRQWSPVSPVQHPCDG